MDRKQQRKSHLQTGLNEEDLPLVGQSPSTQAHVQDPEDKIDVAAPDKTGATKTCGIVFTKYQSTVLLQHLLLIFLLSNKSTQQR